MRPPFKISGKQPHISVFLDDNSDETLKKFHCPVCGRVVFQYYSPVRVMIPGEVTKISDDQKPPLVIQCKGSLTVMQAGRAKTTRCKTIYHVLS